MAFLKGYKINMKIEMGLAIGGFGESDL